MTPRHVEKNDLAALPCRITTVLRCCCCCCAALHSSSKATHSAAAVVQVAQGCDDSRDRQPRERTTNHHYRVRRGRRHTHTHHFFLSPLVLRHPSHPAHQSINNILSWCKVKDASEAIVAITTDPSACWDLFILLHVPSCTVDDNHFCRLCIWIPTGACLFHLLTEHQDDYCHSYTAIATTTTTTTASQ